MSDITVPGKSINDNMKIVITNDDFIGAKLMKGKSHNISYTKCSFDFLEGKFVLCCNNGIPRLTLHRLYRFHNTSQQKSRICYIV